MKDRDNKISNSWMIGIYLLVSVVGIAVMMYVYTGLITEHDNKLTISTDTLIAEKMNNSIKYMTESVYEMATVLSYQDLLELDQLYGQLRGSIKDADYISIGIIAANDTVYGDETERQELIKWGIVDSAKKTEKVTISEPYRSSMSGRLVFTLLSPIYQKGEKLGCIFVTYPLTELKSIAVSEALIDGTEIYLENCFSDNAILCFGNDDYMVGNWSNTRIMKKQVDKDSLQQYEEWERAMDAGEISRSVRFNMNGESYTQVFEKIDVMNGWYVVSRIPNRSLSNNMQQMRVVTFLYVAVLIVMSLLMLFAVRMRDEEEKKLFKYMSTHDSLTGIYNRNAFELVAQKYLNEEGDSAKGVLAFLDVDYFKQINDKFGHDIGDKALIAFAGGLEKCFGENAIVARFGGDEFVVVAKGVDTRAEMEAKLEQFREILSEIKLVEKAEEQPVLHYSAGVVAYPEKGIHFMELLKCADEALYQTKEHGRNGYRWYD